MALYNRHQLKPGADLEGIAIHHERIDGLDLSGAHLAGAVLMHCYFGASKFRGANLEGAELSNSDLPYSNFEGANLANSVLYQANFSGANLKGADLSNADAAGGTIFAGADLRGAILPPPENLVGSSFHRAIIDEEQLPIIREAMELTLAGLQIGGRAPRTPKKFRPVYEVPGEEDPLAGPPYTPGRFENPRHRRASNPGLKDRTAQEILDARGYCDAATHCVQQAHMRLSRRLVGKPSAERVVDTAVPLMQRDFKKLFPELGDISVKTFRLVAEHIVASGEY
jgi:hypothetical protein